MKANKLVSAPEAVSIIKSEQTLANAGFVGNGTPDQLLKALGERYQRDQNPNDLTLIFAAGQGDGVDRGLNYLAPEGLLKRVIGGHWGLIPRLGKLAIENKIEAYNLPQGCISHLYRDIAAGKPGVISKVGLNTFVDPRLNGGKVNDITTEDIVALIEIAGEEWLFYKALPIDVAFIRGTTADLHGNITMEKESLTLENLAIAMAVKNSGGQVIAQVERIARTGSLNARDVSVPGIFVDYIVQAEPEHHMQTYSTQYNPAYSGEIKVPLTSIKPMPLNERKLIARRAASELKTGQIINLGIGMPEGVALVANEERILDDITITAEPGIIGGIPASGLDFGAATNAEAIIDQPYQFDFYDGGGLDLTYLGMAEADQYGNVNVSRFGPKFAGCGGFINISQNSSKVVFCSTFTAGGLKVEVKDGRLYILNEGKAKKFTQQVQQVTFSGAFAQKRRQPVLYITERCVFALTEAGLELIEVAPGIDIQTQILDHMEFVPIINNPKLMPSAIFDEKPMGMKTTG